MNTSMAVDLLEKMQEIDNEFLRKKSEESAATFCCNCRKNTFVGLYPFWHRYARHLCSQCGAEYEKLLKSICE